MSINFKKIDDLRILKEWISSGTLSTRFIFKAIPDLKSQISCYEEIIEELFTPFKKTNNLINKDRITNLFCQEPDPQKRSKQCSVVENYLFANKRYLQAFYSLFPMVDSNSFFCFMICYNMLSLYLDQLCNYKQIKDESILRELYLSMFEAVDPNIKTSNHFSCYNKYFPKGSEESCNLENNYLNYFVDLCRSQLKQMPCYEKVKEYIKKYVYIKVEYYIFKHTNINTNINSVANIDSNVGASINNNENDIIINQFAWTLPFLKHYPGVKAWEFQSIACSDLGLFALLALSFNPSLSEETIINTDRLYFPWINGLQSLLSGYINLYQDMFTNYMFYDDFNCTDCYDNLKQCEERLILFLENSLKSCNEHRDSKLYSIHIILIKLILVVYLSDPRAHFGLKEIATKNLLASAHKHDISFWKTLMSLILPAEYHCAYPN